MTTIFIIGLAGAPLLVLYVVVTYNGLVARRNMVRNMYSGIDVQCKRRAELIPNLVSTVQAHAQHEAELLERITQLRSAVHKEQSVYERHQIEEEIGPALQQLLVVAEGYPALRSNESFLNLQRNLTEVEAQLSAARRAYNAAVTAQRNTIEMFPSSLVASLFSFQPTDYFSATAAQRVPPNVDLS